MYPHPGRVQLLNVLRFSRSIKNLADYASAPSNEQSGQQVRDALLKAQLTLADSNTQSQQGKIFYALLEEAEYMRLSLILLSRSRRRLVQDIPGQASVFAQLDRVLQSAVQELRKIAGELKSSSTFTSATPIKPHQHIKETLTALRQEHRTPDNQNIIEHTLVYGDALLDQLHQARKLAKSWKYAHKYSRISIRKVPRQTYLRVQIPMPWQRLQAVYSIKMVTRE